MTSTAEKEIARIAAGMRPLHATIYAARRRIIPILMTTGTTIGEIRMARIKP